MHLDEIDEDCIDEDCSFMAVSWQFCISKGAKRKASKHQHHFNDFILNRFEKSFADDWRTYVTRMPPPQKKSTRCIQEVARPSCLN